MKEDEGEAENLWLRGVDSYRLESGREKRSEVSNASATSDLGLSNFET